MVVSIQIEQEIAQALEARAAALGITLPDYLRVIADGGGEPVPNGAHSSPHFFDALLDKFFEENPTKLPSLPAGFSRADIYADRD